VIAYAGSPALARQIQAGAPADLYISASAQWMDVLEAEGLVAPGSRRDILGGALVLVAHGRDAAPVAIGPGFDLAGMLDGGRLAMAMVDSVPSGQYGKEALVSLGLWESVKAQVVQSENVRAALALVARGEAPLGIVYASDAVADDAAGDQVSVVGTFPRGSHRPIVFPAAVIAGAIHAEAAADFLVYLSSDAADAIFAAQGFEVPD
jgi:molybdate transport system substrate-binding protein